MPSSPVAYPLGPPVIDGTQITVDEAINNPSRITRDVADLTMLKFYMDQVFSPGGGVEGGALLFERPNPTDTDLFGEREPKEVAPGQAFPLQTFQRGVPMLARPRKIGNKWFITKEAQKRNNTRLLARYIRQTANTIRRRVENMGLAELDAVIAAESRFITGSSWSAAAAIINQNRTGLTEPLADVGEVVETVDLEERGVVLDSVIIHTTDMRFLRAYYGSTTSVRDAFAEYGITNIFVTPRRTAGRPLFFAKGLVGEWRNEFPLQEETEWEGVAAGGRQRWWYQWSISPLFAVDNQFALLELRGVA
jgi:hypothetical protein